MIEKAQRGFEKNFEKFVRFALRKLQGRPIQILGIKAHDRKWHDGGDSDHAKPKGLSLKREKAGLPV